MIVNISAVLQKGEIIKAVQICVHQKLKEWKIINALFSTCCGLELSPGLESGTGANAGTASELQSVQTRDTLGSIAFQPLPQHETLADLQRNLL